MTSKQDSRRYVITAINLLQQVHTNPHPDLRTADSREAMTLADHAAFDAIAALDDSGRAESAALGIRNLCLALSDLVVRMDLAPEAPMEAQVEAVRMAAVTTGRRTLTARMPSDLSAGVLPTLPWQDVFTDGFAEAPEEGVLLRPQVLMEFVRETLGHPSLDTRQAVSSLLFGVHGVPLQATPGGSFWAGLHSSLFRKLEAEINHGRMPVRLQTRAIISKDVKAHVGIPPLPTPAVILVQEGENFTLTWTLEYDPGAPFFLGLEVLFSSNFFERMHQVWVRRPGAVVAQASGPSGVDGIVRSLLSFDERFEFRVETGVILMTGEVLHLEVLSTHDVKFPDKEKNAEYSDYLSVLSDKVNAMFGTREDNKTNASNILGLELLDIRKIHRATKTMFTCGLSIWWSVLPGSAALETIADGVVSFVAGIGRNSPVQEPPVPAPAFVAQNATEDLVLRIKEILANPGLLLPESVKTYLGMITHDLNSGTLGKKQDLVVILPAKLDFIERFHRRGIIMASAEDGLALLTRVSAGIQGVFDLANKRAIRAGVSQKAITGSSEIMARLAFQAEVDADHYKRVPNNLVVRVPHRDMGVGNCTLARYFHPLFEATAVNKDGYMEYKVRLT